jgi:hypothetical protein
MAFHEMTADSEDGFADLSLNLVSLHRDPDGVHHVSARGLHNGRQVGFSVDLGSTWKRQNLDGSDDPIYWGEAHLKSVGEESDAFLQGLDEVYGTNTSRRTMADRIMFTAVSLEGHPLHLQNERVRMKFFFEAEDEERYAEFYLNIDVRESSVEFHEKDVDYRRPVVLCLSSEK